MMPMYGGPGWDHVKGKVKTWWDDKGKEKLQEEARKRGEKALSDKIDQYSSQQSGPTPVSTSSVSGSGTGTGTGEITLEAACRRALTKNPNDPFCIMQGYYIDPVTGLGVRRAGQQLSPSKPTGARPKGNTGIQRPQGGEQQPLTLLEQINKNRFTIVLASSALLLGVILINLRK